MASQGGGGGYASSSSSSSYSSSYNLSKIGNIVFKGELKSIIDELLEKCKKELTETYRQKITEIKTAAMYIPEHNDNLCGWEFVRLEKNIQKTPEYSSFFNLEENSSNYNTRNKPLCYYKRQLIGQEIIPFVDDNDDDDDNNNDNGEGNLISCKQNEHVFDNLFFMKNELCGIKKHKIRFTPNFLNTVDKDECSTLLGFTLDYIGVTTDRMNLYLKPLSGDNPIYCTNASSSKDLPKASKYLEEELFTNIDVVDILKKKHTIKIPKYIEEYHDKIVGKEEEEEEEEEEKENRKKKRKFDGSNKSIKKTKNNCTSSSSSSSTSSSSSSSSSSSNNSSSSSDDEDDENNKYAKDIDKVLNSIKST